MASTQLYHDISSTGNQKTWTFSAWVKKCGLSANSYLYSQGSSGSNYIGIYFDANDVFKVYNEVSSSQTLYFVTNRKFRDASAWYHIVVKCDTTQSTEGDRFKIYINGVQETSFSTSAYPSQNSNTNMNTTRQRIGVYHPDGSSPNGYMNGVMSHIHLTDGYAYDASTFGSTDSTTGEWKINTSPSVTYGTNGFFILKDGNSGTDQSGQSNNFTTSGTLTKTEDCPSNVFATFNPLTSWLGQNRTPSQSINKGNLTTGIGSSEKAMLVSTIGVTSGKYYWEAKSDGVSKLFYGFSNYLVFGTSADPHTQGGYNGVYYYEGTGSADYRTYGSNTSTTGISNISSGDILGFALDMDNYAFYIHKNGTYMNSGSPTSGSSRTGSIPELFTYGRNCLSDYGEVFATAYVTSTSGSGTASFNFGNGYFGTTAVSSAGTNASGIGIFEYDVPAGYTALSTKGLNE